MVGNVSSIMVRSFGLDSPASRRRAGLGSSRARRRQDLQATFDHRLQGGLGVRVGPLANSFAPA
jgi:hypothetical protein